MYHVLCACNIHIWSVVKYLNDYATYKQDPGSVVVYFNMSLLSYIQQHVKPLSVGGDFNA